MSNNDTVELRTQKFSWRTFWLLTGAGVLGVMATIPAALTAQKDLLKDFPIPLWVILPVQILQNAVLIGGAVGVGLWLGKKVGLGAPLVEDRLHGEKIWQRVKGILRPSVSLGIGVAVLISVLDFAVFAPRMPQPTMKPPSTAVWQDLLASVYGGVTEELLMRLGLFTLVTWLVVKISRRPSGLPGVKALCAVNLIVAVLLGLGHLPATAFVFPLTSLVLSSLLAAEICPGPDCLRVCWIALKQAG